MSSGRRRGDGCDTGDEYDTGEGKGWKPQDFTRKR